MGGSEEENRAREEAAWVVEEVDKDLSGVYGDEQDVDESTTLLEKALLLVDDEDDDEHKDMANDLENNNTTTTTNTTTNALATSIHPHLRLRHFIIFLATALCITIEIYTISHLLPLFTHSPSPQNLSWSLSNSTDGSLNLALLYPSLESSASAECASAWETYSNALPCHRDILSATFDAGNATAVREAHLDPFIFTERVCSKECFDGVWQMLLFVHDKCHPRTDRFNLSSYERNTARYFSPLKEDTPVRVSSTLRKRFEAICPIPFWDRKEESCQEELWRRYGVVRGLERGNVFGLREFIGKNERIAGEHLNGSYGAEDMAIKRPTAGRWEQSNKPQCGQCVEDWLTDKATSFRVGLVLDPLSGQALSRPAFYALITRAVGSCSPPVRLPDQFSVLGYLRKNWEQQGWWCGQSPCDEGEEQRGIAQRTIHGLGRWDEPLPQIRAMFTSSPEQRDEALTLLYHQFTQLPCALPLNIQDTLEHIMPDAYLVNHICSPVCRNPIDTLYTQFAPAFSSATYMHPFSQWSRARSSLEPLCSTVEKWHMEEYCAPGYAALGQSTWLFRAGLPPQVEIFLAFEKAFNAFEEKINHMPAYRLTPPAQTSSIFNRCVRRLLVGEVEIADVGTLGLTGTIEAFMSDEGFRGFREDYVRLVKRFLKLEVDATYMELKEGKTPYEDGEAGQRWKQGWPRLGLEGEGEKREGE